MSVAPAPRSRWIPLLSGLSLVGGVPSVLFLPAWASAGLVGLLSSVLLVQWWAEHRRWRRDRETERLDRERAEAELRHRPPPVTVDESAWSSRLDDLRRQRAADQARFAGLAALAGDSLTDSQRFTEGEVTSLLQAFESLGQLAMAVEAETTATFEALLDPGSPSSLEGIVVESKDIAGQLSQFFGQLEGVRGESRRYVSDNRAQLERVADMAVTIEDFFESIRMISLNLSIEASRIGGSTAGKALQVLAQKLRDYSNRAQELSGQQRQVVTGAVESLAGSEKVLNLGFSDIEDRVGPLRHRLDGFPAIIAGAHSRFDGVMVHLAQLSSAVQSVLKDRLGTLQFQDLTRQEHEHLAALLDHFRPAAPEPADPEVRRAELVAIAREFNRRTTTSNERRVLQQWLEHQGLPPDAVEVRGDDHQAGKVMLF